MGVTLQVTAIANTLQKSQPHFELFILLALLSRYNDSCVGVSSLFTCNKFNF